MPRITLKLIKTYFQRGPFIHIRKVHIYTFVKTSNIKKKYRSDAHVI